MSALKGGGEGGGVAGESVIATIVGNQMWHEV